MWEKFRSLYKGVAVLIKVEKSTSVLTTALVKVCFRETNKVDRAALPSPHRAYQVECFHENRRI